MKKFVKVLALTLALVTLATLLVSCGALSGKYKATLGTTFEFKGSKVTIDAMGLGVKVEGKYSIKDNKIKFEFSTKDIENAVVKGVIEEFNKVEYPFEKGDGYIKIGAVKYTKQS